MRGHSSVENLRASIVGQRVFLALLALVLANQIGFGLVIPVLPAYAKSFGLGAADIGFVIAIYGLARFVANVPVGQLAERFGRRHVIILGTAITFLLVGFVTFSQFFARTGAIFAIVPLLGHDRFQMTASRLGAAQTLITALNLALVYFSGSLADRFGRKVVIAPATIASGLALLMWAWSPSEYFYFASAAMWGLGAGLAGPAPAAYIADLAPTVVRARVFAYWRSVSDGGYVVGPILTGFLAERAGYDLPLVMTGAIIAISGVAFWLFAPEFHRGTRVSTTGEAPARP